MNIPSSRAEEQGTCLLPGGAEPASAITRCVKLVKPGL